MTHADSHADLSTLTHADLRQMVERSHIEAAFRSEAPSCFSLVATDGEWRAFRNILLARPSEALLDQQAEFLGDLLFNGVDRDRAIKLTLSTCRYAPDEPVDESEAVAVLRLVLPELKGLEWSNVRRGPGSGPMFSGGDGTPYPACPCCGGLREPNGDFTDEAIGHRPECKLRRVMSAVEIAINSSDATSVNSSDATSNSPTPTSEED